MKHTDHKRRRLSLRDDPPIVKGVDDSEVRLVCVLAFIVAVAGAMSGVYLTLRAFGVVR